MTFTLMTDWPTVGLLAGWLVLMLLTLSLVLDLVGTRQLLMLFPEGRRWWINPAQFASLAAFALLAHFTPF